MSHLYRLVRGGFVLTMITVIIGVGIVGQAAARTKDKGHPSAAQVTRSISGNPLAVSVGDGLQVAVTYQGAQQFFGDTASGTFIAVDGKIYGTHPPAGGSLRPIAFTSVSNAGTTGSGTASDPFKIVTVVKVGTTGIEVTQVTSYVNGDLFYKTNISVANTGSADKAVKIFHAADLYLNFVGNTPDLGYGYRDAASGAVGSQSADRESIQVFIPDASNKPDAYQEAFFSTIWSLIGDSNSAPGRGFNNTIDTSYHDVAAGFQWNRQVNAGGNVQVSDRLSFGLITEVIPPSGPGTPTPKPDRPAKKKQQNDPAQVVVAVKPTPNTSATRGSTVTFVVEAINRGRGPAGNTIITMPLDASAVKVLGVTTSRPAAWVSAATDTELTLQTGKLGSSGDVVTATVTVQVAAGVADGTPLGARLRYTFSDGKGGGKGTSNLPILVAGGTTVNREFYALAVEPAAGPAGSEHGFSATVFVPDETVTFWFNTPDGQVEGLNSLTADGEGKINAAFKTKGLAPGTYSMVARGEWSGLTATGTFVVQ